MNYQSNPHFSIKFFHVESPFNISDFAHKGQLKIENRTGQDQTITGYTATYVATLNGREIILGTDDSAQRFGFSKVSGGTWLFLTKKFGVCIEEINLSEFPIQLANSSQEFIHFYIYELDTLETLKPYGITSAETAHEQGCTFKIRVEMKLAEPIAGGNPIGERNIMVVDAIDVPAE